MGFKLFYVKPIKFQDIYTIGTL